MTEENAESETKIGELLCANCGYKADVCHQCMKPFALHEWLMCRDVDFDYRQENGPGRHYCRDCWRRMVLQTLKPQTNQSADTAARGD